MSREEREQERQRRKELFRSIDNLYAGHLNTERPPVTGADMLKAFEIDVDIAIDTIHKLMNNTKFKLHKDAFIHSDQGAHYTSPRFQKLLKSKNLGQSMSRRGNCWDNAPQESFFGHMKDEINYRSCTTFEELKGIIDNYINYYNNYRYQWNLKRLTPVKYRNQLLAA